MTEDEALAAAVARYGNDGRHLPKRECLGCGGSIPGREGFVDCEARGARHWGRADAEGTRIEYRWTWAQIAKAGSRPPQMTLDGQWREATAETGSRPSAGLAGVLGHQATNMPVAQLPCQIILTTVAVARIVVSIGAIASTGQDGPNGRSLR